MWPGGWTAQTTIHSWRSSRGRGLFLRDRWSGAGRSRLSGRSPTGGDCGHRRGTHGESIYSPLHQGSDVATPLDAIKPGPQPRVQAGKHRSRRSRARMRPPAAGRLSYQPWWQSKRAPELGASLSAPHLRKFSPRKAYCAPTAAGSARRADQATRIIPSARVGSL